MHLRTLAAVISALIQVAVVAYLIGTMARAIRNEKRRANLKHTWKHFGLSIALALLFFVSWVGQGVSQWQQFADEQRAHGESVEVASFVVHFSQSTLENWQSEFLQLFSFVVLAAILIHRGSAESRDSDDQMQEMLKEIRQKLDEMSGAKG
jgi:succinate dehydrogenase hydrophobic anchor subunit